MARHADLKIAADLPVCFRDPHSPWQRGANESTNGLLREDFPKGADLTLHRKDDLDAVAAALNSTPRGMLDSPTAAEALDAFLLAARSEVVATTGWDRPEARSRHDAPRTTPACPAACG